MGPIGVVAFAVAGVAAGLSAGPAADRIATPRYGVGTAGHDPEDLALALLPAPTTPRTRTVAAVLTTLAFGLLALEFDEVEVVVFFAVLAWVYVVAAVVDLQYLRLPDVLTLPAVGIAFAGSVGLAARFDHVEAGVAGIVAGVVVAGFLWAFSAVFALIRRKEAFGLGDVKLQVSLGASAGWLGWTDAVPAAGPVSIVIWVALAGFLVGSLAGLPAAGFKTGKHIPFGPFLMLGWFVVVLLADSLRA